jgi:hypothetical protein
MTGGDEPSARERGSAGAGTGTARLGCWAARVAGSRGRVRARAREQAVWLGRAERRTEEAARSEILFFFFKNVNSISICLFH